MGDQGIPWIQANPIVSAQNNEERYVMTIYWIFTLVTTVGYGDFTGGTKGEYLITVFFQFCGVLIFSMISFLAVKVVTDNYDFSVCLSDKFTRYEHWLSQLEKSNNQNNMQPHLLQLIRKRLEDAYLFDFNLIIEEFKIYQKLSS